MSATANRQFAKICGVYVKSVRVQFRNKFWNCSWVEPLALLKVHVESVSISE
jgi:hypothetical protein